MRRLGWACLSGAGLAAVWVAVAWLNDVTLHFAPLFVGAVVPLAVVMGTEPPSPGRRLAAAGAGAAIACTATAVLAVTGHLAGPALLPAGGAVAEAIALSVGGAAIGLVLGAARRGGE